MHNCVTSSRPAQGTWDPVSNKQKESNRWDHWRYEGCWYVAEVSYAFWQICACGGCHKWLFTLVFLLGLETASLSWSIWHLSNCYKLKIKANSSSFLAPISSCNLQVSCELLDASGHATVPPGCAFSSLPPRASCPASLCAKVSSAQESLQRFSGGCSEQPGLYHITLQGGIFSNSILCSHEVWRRGESHSCRHRSTFNNVPLLALYNTDAGYTTKHNSGQLPINTVSFPCLFFPSFLHGQGSPTWDCPSTRVQCKCPVGTCSFTMTYTSPDTQLTACVILSLSYRHLWQIPMSLWAHTGCLCMRQPRILFLTSPQTGLINKLNSLLIKYANVTAYWYFLTSSGSEYKELRHGLLSENLNFISSTVTFLWGEAKNF